MRPGFLIATVRAESRGARGRLLFVGVCLAVGVSAVTGVAALGGAIEDGVSARSRTLLGADMAVESRRALPADLDAAVATAWESHAASSEGAARRADVRVLASMVVAEKAPPGAAAASRLVELKVVSPNWPLVGELELDPPLSAEDLGAEGIALAPELFAALGVEVGDGITLGGARFTVAARVLSEPDELAFRFQPGPRALVSDLGLERTELVGFGSRVQYKALFAFPVLLSERELAAIGQRATKALVGVHGEDDESKAYYVGDLRFRAHQRAQPALRRGLDRLERYLGLVALLSLLLGATGVAQVVRSWLAQRSSSIAVLRALGWRPREVLALYLAHVASLAFLASILGACLGALMPLALARLAPELLPPELLALWQPAAIARGLALGTGVAAFFALPPLLGVWRVPPARVLRAEAEPLPLPRFLRWSTLAACACAVFGAAWWQSSELRDAAVFAGCLALLAAFLWAASRGLARLARSLNRERLPPALAHGIAALGRPSAGTTGAIVALGLGVLVVVTMQLVQTRLAQELSGATLRDAPSMFFVDVQPDQSAGLRELLQGAAAERIDEVPVVTARLSAIDGRDVRALSEERGGNRARWVLTREQRLTWLEELPPDNKLLAGSLWNDPERFEVSLEVEYADDLGAVLGTLLTFDVQGVPVELTVTSLREVEWRSFGINFFLVAEPGSLDDAPQMRLMAARVPPEAEDRVQAQSAQGFPNVTPLRVRALLARVGEIFERLATAVRVLGALVVLAGLATLAGVAASSAADRGREVALYKTLGVTRRSIVTLYATEYALCGSVAGALGALFALALAATFLSSVLELTPAFSPWTVPAATLACAALATGAGLTASVRALSVRPLASLRG